MNYDSFENGTVASDASEPVSFDAREARRSISKLGFGIAIFVLVSFAVSNALYIAVRLLKPEWESSSLFMNIASDISFYLCALPLCYLIFGRVKASPPEKKKFGLGKWMLALLIGFGLMYIGSYIGNFFMSVLSSAVGYDYSNLLNSVIDSDRLWLTAIFMVVIAPIGEEFIFRKLIIDRTRRYGALCSILISGLAFGLMHGNFYQFFYAAFLGIVLAYIYYTSGNWWICVSVHAIINFVGSILTTLITKGIDLQTADTDAMMKIIAEHPIRIMLIMFYSMFVIAAMACAVVLLIVLRKRFRLPHIEGEIPKGQRMKVIFANAGVIVALVCFALRFALFLIP